MSKDNFKKALDQSDEKFSRRDFLVRSAAVIGAGTIASSIPSILKAQSGEINFKAEELLGKPTKNSITINIVPEETIEYHYQYGTSSRKFTGKTADVTAQGGQPSEIEIKGLKSNKKYYYRMQYRKPGDKSWITRNVYSFTTQRARGSSYTFTITSDIHMVYNSNYQNTMKMILKDSPDFNIDLGDFILTERFRSQEAVDNEYIKNRGKDYFGHISHSVPIFLKVGNHENEEGWNLDDTPYSGGLASIQARKAYYPTPVDEGPRGFYSGNTDPFSRIDKQKYGDQLREDYYAFEWGDCLFVMFDEFQYTPKLSYKASAGEGTDDPVNGDQWSWTLGAKQFQWLKKTLENSKAKYKFMFSHNMLGGILRPIIGVDAGYVRGGAEAARYFEWGGQSANGKMEFSKYRDPKEFGTKPIHQLMVDNKVTAYFHGHDHVFAYEKRDGIVYQECPTPTFGYAYFPGIYNKGKFADYEGIEELPRVMGYLRLKVSPKNIVVDFIRSDNGQLAYSYKM